MMGSIGERTKYFCAVGTGRPACVVSAVAAVPFLGRTRLIVDARYLDCYEE